MARNEYKLVVNPDQFQAIVSGKSKSNETGVKYVIGSREIFVFSSVDVMGGHNDRWWTDKIYLKSENQLNALVELKRYLGN